MKHVQENLENYRDFKFFSVLEQNDKERKEKKSNDPKREQEEKIAAQVNKDVQAIIKKTIENYKRFKSAAGKDILKYKEFWGKQEAAKTGLVNKDPRIKVVYNMYDSDYIVIGKIDPDAYLVVIKDPAAEGENPVCNIQSNEGYESFKNFVENVKKDLQDIKDTYVRTVENKKKEEEERQRREKLEGFLKEEKEEKKRVNEQNQNQDVILQIQNSYGSSIEEKTAWWIYEHWEDLTRMSLEEFYEKHEGEWPKNIEDIIWSIPDLDYNRFENIWGNMF